MRLRDYVRLQARRSRRFTWGYGRLWEVAYIKLREVYML